MAYGNRLLLLHLVSCRPLNSNSNLLQSTVRFGENFDIRLLGLLISPPCFFPLQRFTLLEARGLLTYPSRELHRELFTVMFTVGPRFIFFLIPYLYFLFLYHVISGNWGDNKKKKKCGCKASSSLSSCGMMQADQGTKYRMYLDLEPL